MDGARHLLGMLDPQEMGKVNYLSSVSSQLFTGVEYLGGRAFVGCWLCLLLLPAQGVCPVPSWSIPASLGIHRDEQVPCLSLRIFRQIITHARM